MKREVGSKGRNLALTIIIGIFISIMVMVLVNLIVTYAYEQPDYGRYCKVNEIVYPKATPLGINCTLSPLVEQQTNQCYAERGQPIYNYDNNGCIVSLKDCDLCGAGYEDASKAYNRNVFFIFAIVGFILIVVGLFLRPLLLQIIFLPAGAILVIEAAIRNFDDKLAVIITFALLIIAAIYLALKKLR